MIHATAIVSRRTVLALLAACALATACSSQPTEPPLPELKAAPVLGSVAPDRATLYFFNVGEGSAIGTGRGQDITDNGAILGTVSLTGQQWFVCFALAFVLLLIDEVVKFFMRRARRSTEKAEVTEPAPQPA